MADDRTLTALHSYITAFNTGDLSGVIAALDPEVGVTLCPGVVGPEQVVVPGGRDALLPSYRTDFANGLQVVVVGPVVPKHGPCTCSARAAGAGGGGSGHGTAGAPPGPAVAVDGAVAVDAEGHGHHDGASGSDGGRGAGARLHANPPQQSRLGDDDGVVAVGSASGGCAGGTTVAGLGEAEAAVPYTSVATIAESHGGTTAGTSDTKVAIVRLRVLYHTSDNREIDVTYVFRAEDCVMVEHVIHRVQGLPLPLLHPV